MTSNLLNISKVKKAVMQTPFGTELNITLAITMTDQIRGLSGVKPENFNDNEGMLFFYTKDQLHHFWMPHTFFSIRWQLIDPPYPPGCAPSDISSLLHRK